MRDNQLLLDLLAAESEDAVLAVLRERKLLEDPKRWVYVGDLPNNQSVILNQQSSPAAALVEKITNAIDAILLRRCRAAGIGPRSSGAPPSMADAVDEFFGDMADLPAEEIRRLAERSLVLYATGSKTRPCLSLFDDGEGQLATNFPNTFCSLISGATGSSYKGAVPFVQGRFNMGGTGVLPFCSVKHRLQLIVSRPPPDVAGSTDHEWGFTVFCLFPAKQDPSWKYLVGSDGEVMTAGAEPLGLLPRAGAASGEVCLPRERRVENGTLIKMYDFKAPKTNICGELFKKLDEYLLAPALPLRVIECRQEYKANVMGITVWDRFGDWRRKGVLEPGFEDGASLSIALSTGETIPGEIRVFRDVKAGTGKEVEAAQTGLRALINGQSHARRDATFFRTQKVDKEHVAESMLVTLDCTGLGQDSKNGLFMSNRETFREEDLYLELMPRLQAELRRHEQLIKLNEERYRKKLDSAITDEVGTNALEDLLKSDPTLAELFGGPRIGRVAARILGDEGHETVPGTPEPFVGKQFPTKIERKDGSTVASVKIPEGRRATASFLTDVENRYFSRRTFRGRWSATHPMVTSVRLFNGRLTLTCEADEAPVGAALRAVVTITDKKGSGPFELTIDAVVVAREEKQENGPTKPRGSPKQRVPASPSQPEVKWVQRDPTDPPITIEKQPTSGLLELHVNRNSELLTAAKDQRGAKERDGVEFVFRWGLGLAVMGMIDAAKRSGEWKANEAIARDRIRDAATGIARVIAPLCLALPKKIPKS